jgi:hypothetical protein
MASIAGMLPPGNVMKWVSMLISGVAAGITAVFSLLSSGHSDTRWGIARSQLRYPQGYFWQRDCLGVSPVTKGRTGLAGFRGECPRASRSYTPLGNDLDMDDIRHRLAQQEQEQGQEHEARR